MLTDFGIILLFFIIGALVVGGGLIVAGLIRPSKPNPMKNSTYECGEQLIGGGPWIKFNIRFYVIALVFLLFDVEVVFLLPWATVFKQLSVEYGMGWFPFIEMVVFVIILISGLAYIWAKRDLDWERPNPYVPKLKDLVVIKKNND